MIADLLTPFNVGGAVLALAVLYRLFAPRSFTRRQLSADALARIDWRRAEDEMRRVVDATAPPAPEHTAVIGVGFLGRWLVNYLLHRQARAAAAGKSRGKAAAPPPLLLIDIVQPDLSEYQTHFGADCVRFVRCDITDEAALRAALGDEPPTVIFLTTALISYHQRCGFQLAASMRVNVKGTETVLKVCSELASVARPVRLVQVSTSNVAVGTEVDQTRVLDETAPFAINSVNHYTTTKVLAEKAVLAANAPSRGFYTVAVRPCSGIFGHQDRLITDAFITSLKCEMLAPDIVIDWVYVENVCIGLLQVDAALRENPAKIAGEAFCIGNENPMSNSMFYSTMVAMKPEIALSAPPYAVLFAVAHVSEWLQVLRHYTGGRWSLGPVELLTPATLGLMKLNYRFSSRKAEERVGYRPVFSIEEALHKTVALDSMMRENGGKTPKRTHW